MPSFIVIEKTGSLKNAKTADTADLYKKCGFKSSDGFKCEHTWSVEFNDTEYKLEIYGKVNGRAGSENKYEFPPPIDNVLFFGSCAAILYVNNKMTDMGTQEFKDIMEHLYGGYEDLGGEDDDDDDEDDDDDVIGLPKTKHGYVKDDFVVSSDAEDEDDMSDEDEISEEEEIKPKRKKPVAKKPIVEKKPKKPKLKCEEQTYVELTEELKEEDYL